MDEFNFGGRGRVNKNHDELLKGVFKEFFIEFLRFIYPDADEIFDFSRGVEFMDKELLKIIPDRERKSDGRVADLLVKVYLCDGNECWVLIHTEIEGGNDMNFSFRMFQYNYRIFDRYKVQVESIAFFTGDRNQPRPDKHVRKGIRTFHDFRYISYQIFDHSEAELLAMDNIFAYVVLACQKALLEGKVPEEELGKGRSTIARALVRTGRYDKETIKMFLLFLKNVIFIENEEINEKFDSYIYEITGGSINMGIIEAVKKIELERSVFKGRQEERARAEAEKRAEKIESAKKMLSKGFEPAMIADILSLSIEEVEKLK